MLHGWPQLQGHFPLSHSPEDSEVRIQRNEMEQPSHKKLEWLGNRTHLLQYPGSMNIAAHQVPSCDLEVNFTSSDSQVQARQSRLATLSCFFASCWMSAHQVCSTEQYKAGDHKIDTLKNRNLVLSEHSRLQEQRLRSKFTELQLTLAAPVV